LTRARAFGDYDVANRHFRRYTRGSFLDVLPEELEPPAASYFNATLFPLAVLSRVAWSIKKCLRGSADPKQPAVKQSSDVPVAVDTLFGNVLKAEGKMVGAGRRPPFGLSVAVVARRRARSRCAGR
jgi:hypothetical protein